MADPMTAVSATTLSASNSDSAAPIGEPAIVFDRVTKSYRRLSILGGGRETVALRGVSFTVAPGETIGLLGPNGAGKTTLLKVMTTLVTPTSGRVLINGIDIATRASDARREIGLVTCDERSFYWRLTGRHNLRFFGALYGLSRQRADARIAELLEALDLSHAADRPYQEFSAGMKQKLAIARGLLAEPKVVLYDEPTRSLDPLSSQNIRRWIIESRARHPGQTHVVATHQLSEAEALCDRVIILSKGRILTEGLVEDIRRRFHARDYEVHRIRVTGTAPVPCRNQPEAGLVGLFDEGGEGETRTVTVHAVRDSEGLSLALAAVLSAGLRICGCESEQAAFDDVFCSLILADRLPAEGQ